MANLDGQGVLSYKIVDVPGLPNKVGIWVVKLSGAASDTFTVPNLSNSTVSLAILLRGAAEDPEVAALAAQASITVTAAANEGTNPGEAVVTVTNSVTARKRNVVVITTLHPKQVRNFPGRDVDPT